MGKPLVGLNEARHLFSYDPITGDLSWRVQKCGTRKGHVCRSLHRDGYLRLTLHGRQYFVHRIAWLIQTGKWPDGVIDHINQDRSDNRWVNLRSVTQMENARNARKNRDNKSGQMGVSKKSPSGRWVAQITVNRKIIGLGSFERFEDAVCARKEAEAKYGFHKNHGNEPEQTA